MAWWIELPAILLGCLLFSGVFCWAFMKPGVMAFWERYCVKPFVALLIGGAVWGVLGDEHLRTLPGLAAYLHYQD